MCLFERCECLKDVSETSCILLDELSRTKIKNRNGEKNIPWAILEMC